MQTNGATIAEENRGYWDALAHQFQHLRPPLRPCAQDIRVMEQAIHGWQPRDPRFTMNAVLLGVTPEIVDMAWPPGSRLLAVDKSQPMIDRYWRGNIPGTRRVVRENWLRLELRDHSLDLVIGDGILTPLVYPDQYRALASSISRWLRPPGRLILRVFVRPARTETLEEILADLEAARISSFDLLKWRLAMTLHRNIDEGVVLADIHKAWARLARRHSMLVAQAGWSPATVNTINHYAGRLERYSFPTLDEVHAVFAPALRQIGVITPDYPFGACFPVVVYRQRG